MKLTFDDGEEELGLAKVANAENVDQADEDAEQCSITGLVFELHMGGVSMD